MLTIVKETFWVSKFHLYSNQNKTPFIDQIHWIIFFFSLSSKRKQTNKHPSLLQLLYPHFVIIIIYLSFEDRNKTMKNNRNSLNCFTKVSISLSDSIGFPPPLPNSFKQPDTFRSMMKWKKKSIEKSKWIWMNSHFANTK